MFYTIEDEASKSYYRGFNALRDPHSWTADAEQSHTYGRFFAADADAMLLSHLVGKRLSVVRYDGAWIKTARRMVVEVHG